jgi:hypothetical protein
MGGFLLVFNALSRSLWDHSGLLTRALLFAAESLGAVGIILLLYTLLKVEMLRYFIRRKKKS